jgi:hypothetical protein
MEENSFTELGDLNTLLKSKRLEMILPAAFLELVKGNRSKLVWAFSEGQIGRRDLENHIKTQLALLKDFPGLEK